LTLLHIQQDLSLPMPCPCSTARLTEQMHTYGQSICRGMFLDHFVEFLFPNFLGVNGRTLLTSTHHSLLQVWKKKYGKTCPMSEAGRLDAAKTVFLACKQVTGYPKRWPSFTQNASLWIPPIREEPRGSGKVWFSTPWSGAPI